MTITGTPQGCQTAQLMITQKVQEVAAADYGSMGGGGVGGGGMGGGGMGGGMGGGQQQMY